MRRVRTYSMAADSMGAGAFGKKFLPMHPCQVDTPDRAADAKMVNALSCAIRVWH